MKNNKLLLVIAFSLLLSFSKTSFAGNSPSSETSNYSGILQIIEKANYARFIVGGWQKLLTIVKKDPEKADYVMSATQVTFIENCLSQSDATLKEIQRKFAVALLKSIDRYSVADFVVSVLREVDPAIVQLNECTGAFMLFKKPDVK